MSIDLIKATGIVSLADIEFEIPTMFDTKEETVTAFAAAKLVNAYFAARKIEKVLPPQMFYTYAKKGYIVTQDDAKKVIAVKDLEVWFAKYLKKNVG